MPAKESNVSLVKGVCPVSVKEFSDKLGVDPTLK